MVVELQDNLISLDWQLWRLIWVFDIHIYLLTLKALVTTAADSILDFFYIFFLTFLVNCKLASFSQTTKMLIKIFWAAGFWWEKKVIERNRMSYFSFICGNIEMLSKICSRQHSIISFFRENKSWYFMWTVCLADNSHEISRLVFAEKQKKKEFQNVCCSCDWRCKG